MGASLTTRKTDGKRVEHKVPVELVREFPSESSAWQEAERQHLNVNTPDFRGAVKFSGLAEHYIEHELGDQTDAVDPKSHTTIRAYKRILRNRLIPRWGTRVELGIEPLEIEQWLKAVKKDERLENPTVDKMRRVMSLVFKSGMRYGLIPRDEESNPLRFVRCKTQSEYEALILIPKQAFDLFMGLPEPERTLTLLAAATGLRCQAIERILMRRIQSHGPIMVHESVPTATFYYASRSHPSRVFSSSYPLTGFFHSESTSSLLRHASSSSAYRVTLFQRSLNKNSLRLILRHTPEITVR